MTGLALVPARRQEAWRLARTSYGAMNPSCRPLEGPTCDWGRYDVAGRRTVYCASPEVATYAESLAVFRPGLVKLKPEGPEPLLARDWFDEEPGDETTLEDLVRSDWLQLHHPAPGAVPAVWRHNRLMHRLTLPADGWFIDIEAAHSVAALRRELGPRLGGLGLDQLTVGTLRGEHREYTTAIAGWAWHQVLDDGTRPHGIKFGSKHGSDWACWAIWLRHVDAGASLADEPTSADSGREVLGRHHNPALHTVANLFELTVH